MARSGLIPRLYETYRILATRLAISRVETGQVTDFNCFPLQEETWRVVCRGALLEQHNRAFGTRHTKGHEIYVIPVGISHGGGTGRHEDTKTTPRSQALTTV